MLGGNRSSEACVQEPMQTSCAYTAIRAKFSAAPFTSELNRISDLASEEALLVARHIHEGRISVQVKNSFLLGGNVTQTVCDRWLETPFLARLPEKLVGGGRIPA